MPRDDGSLTPADKRRRKRLNTPIPGFYGKILKWEDIVREGVTIDAREFTQLKAIDLEGQFHFLFVWRWCSLDEMYAPDLQVRYRRTSRSHWRTIGLLEEMMDYTPFIQAGYPVLPIMTSMHDIGEFAEDWGVWGFITDVACVLEDNGYDPEGCIPVQ